MICVSVDSSGYVVSLPQQPADYSTCSAVLVSGDELHGFAQFDADAFAVGFKGVLLLFAVGAGVGLIINVLRRARP